MTGDVGANTALIVGQIMTFLTVLVSLVYNAYRERRNRRWAIEDRDALASKVAATGVALAVTALGQHTEVVAAIAENTVKTDQATAAAREAYTEANDVNLKIASLGIHIAENVKAMAVDDARRAPR
jgi:hypothetical protein